MKLAVFGATGGTGLQVVRQAIGAGHRVTAVVRDPARLPSDLAGRVEVVKADVMDAAAIAETIKGRDAVINAVGARDLSRPTTVCTDSARSIITAAQTSEHGIRLITASNSAMTPGPGDDPFTRYVVKPMILARLLRHMIDDMRRAEELVRGCGQPWTIIRAGRLTDRPGKGTYRRAIDRNVLGGFQITRADFATALLDATFDSGTVEHAVSVGN